MSVAVIGNLALIINCKIFYETKSPVYIKTVLCENANLEFFLEHFNYVKRTLVCEMTVVIKTQHIQSLKRRWNKLSLNKQNFVHWLKPTV